MFQILIQKEVGVSDGIPPKLTMVQLHSIIIIRETSISTSSGALGLECSKLFNGEERISKVIDQTRTDKTRLVFYQFFISSKFFIISKLKHFGNLNILGI